MNTENKKLTIDIPGIDTEVLKKQALESATKCAVAEIKEFYEGRNSPYREAIKEELKSKNISEGEGYGFCVPQVVGLLNEALSSEIDRIINNSIANSYLPMVSEMLTGIEKELKLSEVVEKLKNSMGHCYDGEIYVHVAKDGEYGWYELIIRMEKSEYDISLHTNHEKPGTYYLLSMPWKKEYHRTMRLYYDEKKYLELPLEMNVINDKVALLCAKLLIANTAITIDFEGEYDFGEAHDYD